MLKHGKQKQTLIAKQGFISNPLDSIDKSGLLDVIRMSNPISIVTFINPSLLACIDNSGNPFLFYYEKNRYIQIKATSPATQIVFIDRTEGQLAISTKMNTIQICSVNNGKLLKTLYQEAAILNLHVNHLRNLLLSVSSNSCTLWSIMTYEKTKTLHAKNNRFVNACFMPNGQELATIFDDQSLCVWTLSEFEVVAKFSFQDAFQKCSLINQGQNLLINTNTIYKLERGGLSELSLSATYGGTVLQVRPGLNGCLFILTKMAQIICVDATGLVTSLVPLPPGKTPVCFDVQTDKLAVVLNTLEILIFDSRKLQRVEQANVASQEESQKENISSANECSAINIQVRKVGESMMAQPFQASQSSVMKRRANNSSDQSIQNQPYNTCTLTRLFKQSSQDPLKTLLNASKLQNFLKQFGQFPEEQRSLAWRSLLDLPLNEEAYQNLAALGVHEAYKNLAAKYPIQQQQLLRNLQKVLSCLAYYCPLFAEVEYLPELVFPLVKLFRRGEELIMFESVLTLLVHVCQHFFESFPNAPVELLSAFDLHLKKLDPDLYAKMVSLGYSNVRHAWPTFRCFFSDILNHDQFVQFMDHVVAEVGNNPFFFINFLASYVLYFKSVIYSMKEPEQLDIFFSKQNAFPIKKLLSDKLPPVDVPYNQNFPLAKTQYQVFNLYPKHSVQLQKQVREEIQNNEAQMERQRRNIQTLQELSQKMLVLEEEFKARQSTLMQSEKDRREMLAYEMEMKAQKQLLQQQEIREKRLFQIQQIESLIKTTLQQQEEFSSQDQELLDREFQKFSQVSNLQLQNRQEEEALRNLEFQAFSQFNQLIQQRNQLEKQDQGLIQDLSSRKVRKEMEFRYRQKEYQDALLQEQWKTSDQEHKLKQDLAQYHDLMKVQQMKEQNDKAILSQQQILQQTSEQIKMMQLEKERRLREIAIDEQEKLRSQGYYQPNQSVGTRSGSGQRFYQNQSMGDQSGSGGGSINDREKFDNFRYDLERQLQQTNTMDRDEMIEQIVRGREQELQTKLSNIRSDIRQESYKYNYSPEKSSQDPIYQTGDFHQQKYQQQYSPGSMTYGSQASK